MSKRLLYIIVFILLVIAFGAMIYFVFIKDLVAPSDTNENVNANINANINVGLPVTNGAVVNRITNISNINGLVNFGQRININGTLVSNFAQGGATLAEEVVDTHLTAAEPLVSGDGIRYYDYFDGKFYRLDADGEPKLLSDQLFPHAEDIAWSPKGDQAVITFPDGSKIMYDFDQQNQVTLPKEWDDIQFSPSGNQIAFKNITDNEDSRWLALSNPDGTEVTLIEPLGDKANDVAVNWSPNNQVVATYREGYSGTAQEVYLIGLHGENFKSLLTDGRGFEGIWSPTGDQLLYSVYNAQSQYNPSLYLVDAVGDDVGANKIQLGLQTWSSKCTFASNESAVYCAVPSSLPTGSGLSPSLAGDTNDLLYKIDTNTGSKSLIALPTFLSGDRDYSIKSMFLSNNERTLYFIDETSGQLYSVQI